MPTFGPASEKQLATCAPDLVKVLREAIKYFDFTVVEGFRNEEDQNKAYAKGLSKQQWPHGNHNSNPSKAADCAPYPIDWSEKETAHQRFCILAGVILTVAQQLGIIIRWGGDWNRNEDTRDEKFRDLPHFELIQD